jgi:hypothetical protein
LLSTISYLPHIFLYNLEVKFSKGTYSWDQEVYEAKTFLVPYRKIQYEKHLAWNTSGKLKLLGIHFNLYKEDKTLENFGEKINPPSS